MAAAVHVSAAVLGLDRDRGSGPMIAEAEAAPRAGAYARAVGLGEDAAVRAFLLARAARIDGRRV